MSINIFTYLLCILFNENTIEYCNYKVKKYDESIKWLK